MAFTVVEEDRGVKLSIFWCFDKKTLNMTTVSTSRETELSLASSPLKKQKKHVTKKYCIFRGKKRFSEHGHGNRHLYRESMQDIHNY